MSTTAIPTHGITRNDGLGILLAAGIPGHIVFAGTTGDTQAFIIDEGELKYLAEVSRQEARFSPVLEAEDPDEAAHWLANLTAITSLEPATVLSSFRLHRKASIVSRVLAGSDLRSLHGIIESVNSARQLIVLRVGGTAYTLSLGRDHPRLSTADGVVEYNGARKVLTRVAEAAGLNVGELISALHEVFRTAERGC